MSSCACIVPLRYSECSSVSTAILFLFLYLLEQDLIKRLQNVLKSDFVRITYTQVRGEEE